MSNTTVLTGLGVSPGIGIGKSIILKRENIIIPKAKACDVSKEKYRFLEALESVKNETKSMIANSKNSFNKTKIDILNAYLMIIDDKKISSEIIHLIEEKQLNAESAVNNGFNIIIKNFELIESEYIKERAFDLLDIRDRLLRKLMNIKIKNISNLNKDTIIITKDFTLSDSLQLDFSSVNGIVSQIGGKNSHASIIARSLEIPSIFNVKNALKLINDGDTILLDGEKGEIVINPSNSELLHYKSIHSLYILNKNKLKAFKNKDCHTLDNRRIKLYANVSSPVEAKKSKENSAEGIGLFRSELIFLNRPYLPTEDEQYNIYSDISEFVDNKDVTIRTIDIGGDKFKNGLSVLNESNPSLGYRGIRICLKRPDIFKTQIRAILRANQNKNIKILLPMISSIHELRSSKNIIEEAKFELLNEGITFNKSIKVGIMIETPACAIMADTFAKECDFFSIGTNDLIQYTAAVDRNNSLVSELYSPYHPSVLRLIANTVKVAKENNIPCCLCGEMASNSLMLPVLIGLGIKSFSVSPNLLLDIKEKILNINYSKMSKISQSILNLEDEIAVEKALLKI